MARFHTRPSGHRGFRRSGAPILGSLFFLAALPLAPAGAQEALYGKQAPPGSAFVRFISALPAPVVIKTNFNPEAHLGTSSTERVGAYGVVERAGERVLDFTVQDGSHSGQLSLKVAPDSYVTVVLSADVEGKLSMVALTDQPDFNRTRARISFYNLASGCKSASLVLEQGGAAVFKEVAAGSVSSRAVNPVQASVQVKCGEAVGPSLALNGLETGASYSIWLLQPDKQATLSLTPDVQANYKP